MAAVTVGHQEKNDQSVVPSMPFTSPHQRLECTATHSILAGWFNPFTPLTGSKHHIHHNLRHFSNCYNPILPLILGNWAFQLKIYNYNGKSQNIICINTQTKWYGHTHIQVKAAHLSHQLLKWDYVLSKWPFVVQGAFVTGPVKSLWSHLHCSFLHIPDGS